MGSINEPNDQSVPGFGGGRGLQACERLSKSLTNRAANWTRHAACCSGANGVHFTSEIIAARVSMSMPTVLRLYARLATSVVPLPQKGSKMLSPGLLYFSRAAST